MGLGPDRSSVKFTRQQRVDGSVGANALRKQKSLHPQASLLELVGGVDGTRTRDPRRDRPVF
jgi:hypothetical protein